MTADRRDLRLVDRGRGERIAWILGNIGGHGLPANRLPPNWDVKVNVGLLNDISMVLSDALEDTDYARDMLACDEVTDDWCEGALWAVRCMGMGYGDGVEIDPRNICLKGDVASKAYDDGYLRSVTRACMRAKVNGSERAALDALMSEPGDDGEVGVDVGYFMTCTDVARYAGFQNVETARRAVKGLVRKGVIEESRMVRQNNAVLPVYRLVVEDESDAKWMSKE